MAKPKISEKRRALLAKVHLARKELAMPEESYRDFLERETGRRSAGACTDLQLGDVLAAFRRDGWHGGDRAAGDRQRALPDTPHGRKVRALWLALYHLGEVKDPSEAALDAFARRQTDIDSLRWVTPDKAALVIEALKEWCGRAGFDVPATKGDAIDVPQDVEYPPPTAQDVTASSSLL